MSNASIKELGLPFIRRTDLVVREMSVGDRAYWTVKDPVSLSFFQLREEEHFIFSRLTKDATVESVVTAFERVYAPARLSLAQLDAYLRSLLAMGLIVHRSSDGEKLLAGGDRLSRASWMAAIGNPLVIRWRGVNPSLLINAVYPLVQWCFSSLFFVASIALMLLAGTWMAIHHEELMQRLPAMSAFISVHNLVWIAVAIGLAKIIHEFAHALTCKHFGGECREMGLMLLVFTPCLYCNVSDAWLMRNRWHRIAISGAGIFTELLLAAIASFIWWFSEPGVLNSICLNMMIVCSINTLLFNGNPLLKYDGYYVLADLVEVPNLAARAKSRLTDILIRLTCGVRFTNPRSLPARGELLLIGYGVAAFFYRWFVLCLILWSLHQLLRPMGMVVIAQLITVSCLATFLIAGFRSWRGTRRKLSVLPVNRLRVLLSLTLLGFVAFTIWNWQIPRHVSAPATIQPTDATTVYVEERGRIANQSSQLAQPGHAVKKGDILVVLENPELNREILKLRERIEILQLRIKTLEASELKLGRPNENLPATKELLASLQKQMDRLRVRYNKLTIRAPEDGIVMNARSRAESHIPNRLKSWSGSPLDPSNVGCTLDRGTSYCLIGDPSKLSATLVVDESDIEMLQTGQTARVWLRENPGSIIHGEIQRISETEIERAPDSLISNDDVKVIDEGGGQSRMASTSFNVRVLLQDAEQTIPVRSTGWAKIDVPKTTVGTRVKQYLLRTFRLAQ